MTVRAGIEVSDSHRFGDVGPLGALLIETRAGGAAEKLAELMPAGPSQEHVVEWR